MNQELLMNKLGLEKAEELEVKLPTFVGSWRYLQIVLLFLFLLYTGLRKRYEGNGSYNQVSPVISDCYFIPEDHEKKK